MSLSDPEVIEILNSRYVPVYVANEDYREGGSATSEAKAELSRIHREGHAAKLSVGTVHAYVLAPDGRLLDSMHVASAASPGKMLPMLRRWTAELGVTAGRPIAEPQARALDPAPSSHLRLEIISRYLRKDGDEYALITGAGGNWSAFPAEDRLALSPQQQRALLPPTPAAAGATWSVGGEVASLILNRFYPPTENNDLSKNRIEHQLLRGEVIALQNGLARARLAGRYRMKHPFYHKDDARAVEADLHGWIEWEPATGAIRRFELVTDEGWYRDGGSAGQPFGAVLRIER